MDDNFATWKTLQDAMIAAQRAQLEAASKLMNMNENFDNALQAAQEVAKANAKAWDIWMGMWGVRK